MRLICSMLQSLVRRVTREAVENFSMFRKEYSCTWSYWALRSWAPKPCPAREDKNALPMPRAMDTRAISTICRPFLRIKAVSPAGMPVSTMSAITRGSRSSKTASPPEQRTPSTIKCRCPRV